jgi:proline iminopeptidase
LAVQYLLDKGLDGIVSLTLSGPLLSTPKWIMDADLLREELPETVQVTLRQHENAGTTDSDEYEKAAEVFYERFLYHGERPEIPDCEGSAFNGVVYEHMWGPTEFYATGNLLDFDVTDRLSELDLPVLFIVGQFDEARPETVGGFQKLVPGARLEIIDDAGHASLSRNPERYREILQDFLRDAESGAMN